MSADADPVLLPPEAPALPSIGAALLDFTQQLPGIIEELCTRHSVGKEETGGEAEEEWQRSIEYSEQDGELSVEVRGEEFDTESLQLETRGITSQSQPSLWRTQTIFKESIVSKLRRVGRLDLYEKLADCHTEKSYVRCCGCAKQTTVWNRCERFYCPECQPRLSRDRRRAIDWWTKAIGQPKHVVLTARNSQEITREKVQAFKKALASLRRSKFARPWRGGMYSLEVTNEGRGWHLHAHLLVDCRWIDARELAKVWGRLVGQDFAVVKVKDVRGETYLNEVTKYAVKGNELAEWTGEDIAAFIDAFTNVRTFGCFGSLYKQRIEFREYLDALRELNRKCECGCSRFQLIKWWEAELGPRNHDDGRLRHSRTDPPQPELFSAHFDHNRELAALAR